MKHTAIKVLSLLLILTFIIPAFTACDSLAESKLKKQVKSESAADLLANAIDRTADAIKDSDSPLDKMLNGGSFGVTVSSSDVTLNGKVYTNADDEKFALDFNAKGDGQKLDARLFLNADELIIDSDALLTKAIGIKFDTFADDYDESIFASKDEDLPGLISAPFQVLGDIFPDGPEGFKEELKQIYKDIINGIDKYGTLTVEDAAVTTLGEDVDVRSVNASISGKQLIKFAEEYFDDMDEDSFAMKIIKNLVMSESVFDDESHDVSYYVHQALEEAKENIDDYKLKFTIKADINKNNGALALFSIKISGYMDDESVRDELLSTAKVTLEFGSLDEFRGVKAKIEVTENNDKTSVELGLTKSEDEDGVVIYKLYCKEDGEYILNISLTLDKSEEKFTLSVKVDGDTLKFNGKYKATKTTATLTLTSVKAGSAELMLDDIKIVLDLKASDKMPAAPKYKNFKDLEEEDMEEIAEKAEEYNDLVELIGEMFGGSASVKEEPYDPYYDYNEYQPAYVYDEEGNIIGEYGEDGRFYPYYEYYE